MFHRMRIIIEISIIMFYLNPPDNVQNCCYQNLLNLFAPVTNTIVNHIQPSWAVQVLVNPSAQPMPKLLRFWAAEEKMSGCFFMLMTETADWHNLVAPFPKILIVGNLLWANLQKMKDLEGGTKLFQTNLHHLTLGPEMCKVL